MQERSKGKCYGSKRSVARHRTQVASSADRQERAIERRTRRVGKKEAAER